MADQGRWFKLWVTAPADDTLQSLPVPLRWAWVVLGAYTKLHGTGGAVEISTSNAVLAAEMGVTVDRLLETLHMLPHIDVTVVQNRHDSDTVTVKVVWHNWVKYQEDSTQAQRARDYRASRSKKRREEIRREVPPISPTEIDVLVPPTAGNGHLPMPISEVLARRKAELLAQVAEAEKRARAHETPRAPEPEPGSPF